MNNRQKAKRFKKLYELELELFKTKPLTHITYPSVPLKKYKCNVKAVGAATVRKEAIHIMAQHFETLASEHIEYNKELGQYELTLWLKE